MKKHDYFNDLRNSPQQAINFKNGDKSQARVTVMELPVPQYEANDIISIRKRV